MVSANVDREIGWERVQQRTAPFIALLKGAMLPDSPGARQGRRGQCDGCDEELLLFSEKLSASEGKVQLLSRWKK